MTTSDPVCPCSPPSASTRNSSPPFPAASWLPRILRRLLPSLPAPETITPRCVRRISRPLRNLLGQTPGRTGLRRRWSCSKPAATALHRAWADEDPVVDDPASLPGQQRRESCRLSTPPRDGGTRPRGSSGLSAREGRDGRDSPRPSAYDLHHSDDMPAPGGVADGRHRAVLHPSLGGVVEFAASRRPGFPARP